MIYLKKIPFYTIVFLFIWFPFQDLIISFIYREFPSDLLKYLLVFKEFLLAVVLLMLFVKFVFDIKRGESKISYVEIFGLIYILICLFYFLYFNNSEISLITKMTSFRSAIIPILFVLVGKWINLDKDEILFLFKIILIISTISIFIGFIEINISTDKFWNGILNLKGYLNNIKGFREGLNGGLIKSVPGNFWGSIGYRRMAGSFASPLALSYFLIVPVLFLLYKKNNKFWELIILFLLLAGLIFTETRAAIFSIIIGFIFYFFINLKHLKLPEIKKKIIIFPVILIVLFLIFVIFSKYSAASVVENISVFSGRNEGHIEGIKAGISNLKNSFLIGNGFGTAGSWAALQNIRLIGAGESTYLVLIAEIGGLGFLFFLLWWIFIFFYLIKNYKNSIINNRNMVYLFELFICLNFIYFATGFISEQILTFTSVAHFWILNGSLINFYTDIN